MDLDTLDFAREMSPSGVAVLFMMVMGLDYLSLGPDWLRDRILLIFGIAAWRDGFDGSQLDQWTLEKVTNGIDLLLTLDKLAYIGGASAAIVVGCAISILAVWALGALMPDKPWVTKYAGKWAKIDLPSSNLHQLNYKIHAVGAALGMFSDLAPGGALGGWVDAGTNWTTQMAAAAVMFLFGAV